MNLLESLIEKVPKVPVDEVTIGVFSTLIKAGDLSGIASTLHTDKPHQRIPNSGQLRSYNLQELAKFSLDRNLITASIGVAAINCFHNSQKLKYRFKNAKEIILEKGKNLKVGVIGHFPFLSKMKPYFSELYIFEKEPQTGDLSEIEIPRLLPQCEVVALTATSITNHTFSKIMKYCSDNAFVIMLGPTTPLSPLLFDYGLDVIAGTIVEDYEVFKRHVIEATPTKYLKGKKFVILNKKDYLC